MSSLRETKDHIASVRGTLKITSAMKLVASAKLRKAQKAIEALRPYEEELSATFSAMVAASSQDPAASRPSQGKVAVVAIASNSSLCGGFNANVVRAASEVISECGGDVEVFAVGRKVSDAMKRAGRPSPGDYSEIVAHPSYAVSSVFARRLAEGYEAGEFSKVVLVYSHFVSVSRQEVKVETWLPFSLPQDRPREPMSPDDYLVEPSAETLVREMLPQVILLKFHAAVLDSLASEHAARMIAMQTATDNANDMLTQLTLEYNKARQQKITSEILDIIGGSVR